MKGKFKIVVPSFNSVNFLPKTLRSIEKQLDRNFDVCVIDDASTLKEQREIILDFCQRNGWIAHFSPVNRGQVFSILEGVKELKCQDQDVIVLVDGDDWLYDEHVLTKLAKVYEDDEVYLTWGQFETDPPGCTEVNYAYWIDHEVIEKQQYRQILDVFNHLRTWKYRLFREIRDADLRDPHTHEYFRVSGDKALLYPMLEMAGYRVRFIPDVLYVYNLNNPISDFNMNRKEQMEATAYIRSLKPYSVLNTGNIK